MKSTESRKNFISKSLLFSICLAIFICITSAVLLQNRTARIDTVTAYAEDIADNSIEIENRYATGCILETEQEKLSVPMISFEGISTLSEQVVDHTDAFPTPGDQGRQGSCTAWAVGYAAKSIW